MPLYLDFEQSAEQVTDSRFSREWKMSTRAYHYGLLTAADQIRNPLIAWDWHPGTGIAQPHIHVGVDDYLGRGRRLHIPTGSRVAIEQVVQFLIQDMDVTPANPEWATILDDALGRFNMYQTQDSRR